VAGANQAGTDFPIQNLPYGVFLREGRPRVGIAIGDGILDVAEAAGAGLFTGMAEMSAQACRSGRLNELMELGPGHWAALRLEVSRLLRQGAATRAAESCLVDRKGAKMSLPAHIGNFTDFYTSIHHATNAGQMMRPDAPLLPNFKHMPVAYHGRASSVSVSGTPVRRPKGQSRAKNASLPSYGPTGRMDFELEVGFYVGPGNAVGETVALADAPNHIFGLSLVNDWSARDIQSWEYQPLGPFLAKSFLTSVSPWIVTLEALAPFRVAAADRGSDAPGLLAHLDDAQDRAHGGIDLQLDVLLQTPKMRGAGMSPERIGGSNFDGQYWTIFQMLAHHTSNGCNLLAGDLVASGTVSGPGPSEAGCLLEMTSGGAHPVILPNGESRGFLEDGDEILLRGFCERVGTARIGFGECVGRIEG
jgi:fumarylacetoacetase